MSICICLGGGRAVTQYMGNEILAENVHQAEEGPSDPSASSSSSAPAPPPPPELPANEPAAPAAPAPAGNGARAHALDSFSYQILAEGGEVLGRYSVIKRGQRGESFSVYCRLHGCRIMKLMKHNPSQDQVVRWLEQGGALGRGSQFAPQHRMMWPANG